MHIMAVPKELIDNIKKAQSEEEVFELLGNTDDEDNRYLCPSQLCTVLSCEVGKYYGDPDKVAGDAEQLKWLGREHTECDCLVGDKEIIQRHLEMSRAGLVNHFERLLNSGDERVMKIYLEERIHSWQKENGIFDLDPTTPDVSQNWYYETSLFNLVSLHNTVDWDTHYCVIAGW